MEAILWDIFALNNVITSAIALTASHFIKFGKIPWKHGNSEAMGKFRDLT